MIMQERRVAPIRLSQNVCRLKPPLHHAIASAPTTPNAADSVAVAQPSTITTMMKRISARQGMRLRLRRSFSANVNVSVSLGVLPGLSRAHTMMYPEKRAMSRNPGRNPARKTLRIETSAATAYTTMMIDGGSRMPSVPAPQSDPRQVFSS